MGICGCITPNPNCPCNSNFIGYCEPISITYNSNGGKTPYMCPVCMGKGGFKNDKLLQGERLNRFQYQDETGGYDRCHPCGGAGVLWG